MQCPVQLRGTNASFFLIKMRILLEPRLSEISAILSASLLLISTRQYSSGEPDASIQKMIFRRSSAKESSGLIVNLRETRSPSSLTHTKHGWRTPEKLFILIFFGVIYNIPDGDRRMLEIARGPSQWTVARMRYPHETETTSRWTYFSSLPLEQ